MKESKAVGATVMIMILVAVIIVLFALFAQGWLMVCLWLLATAGFLSLSGRLYRWCRTPDKQAAAHLERRERDENG